MVCDKCGIKEILYYQREKQNAKCCPKCNGLHILTKEDSIKLCEKQYQFVNDIFLPALKKYNKKNFLVWLLDFREKLYSKFIIETPFIKLNELLSINILIKKVIEYSDETGGIEIDKTENVMQILSSFQTLIEIKEHCYLIEEDFGYYIVKEDIEIENINPSKLFSNFEFVYDEDWIIVIESFDQNLIMTAEEGKKFLDNYQEEYERVKNNTTNVKMNTPGEYIHNLYPLLQSFTAGLTKNKLFESTFNFDYLEDKKVLIGLFQKLINNFGFQHGLLTFTNRDQFEQFLQSEFKDLDQIKLYKDLVYNGENQDIFPLFVEYEDKVVISLYFTNLIELFYYSIYYKDLFRKETEALSEIFEKIDVPNEFHKNGFNVRVNTKKKNKLEIDTIAWNNNTLYIVESKIWDIRPFFEHRRVHGHRERDLKGIVDGFKYTGGNPKPIPNLTDKVNYVKNNLEKNLCDYKENMQFPDHADVDYNNIKEFIGVAVTKSYPPIKEYKNVKMVGFREIGSLGKK
ncbi:hypothetical protein [Methanolobus psychrotolerans]|uniref:hypothetical protein n=1 Tax=Methanolobus psychrotolerans TaxID=1874706 RepID=UPI000B91C473|nr:hypothetical protein [Methanolobus psychrotolerans]